MSRRLRGIGVAPGVAVGRAHRLGTGFLPVLREAIPPERTELELERFERARRMARDELRELRQRLLQAVGEQYAAILEAQLLMVDDPRLVEETSRQVREGRVSARWALKQVVERLLARFDAVDDPYLRERRAELADVHQRMQRLLSSRGGEELPAGPVIVVARAIGPSDAAALAQQGIAGLATDEGGRTSHTAILARALGVPAVVGLSGASPQVVPGTPVVVDGDAGALVLDPTPEELDDARRREAERVAREAAQALGGPRGATSRDGTAVALRANLELPGEVEVALRYGAQGIGLYRSEFLFLAHAPTLPDEEQHYRTYRELARRVAPEPAVLRTLDLGGEKYFLEVLETHERNPVLGLRGVRLCLRRPDLFRPQLRALLRAAVEDNLRMLIPLVVSTEEVRAVRALLATEAEALKTGGIPARADVPLGIMIEVPAAAAAADFLAREADFLSVGSNDLFQYALAVDRGNASVAELYSPLHPGLLRLMRGVVEAGRAHGRPVALCGELAADPTLAPLLLGLGLRELSMPPRALPLVRQAIGAAAVRTAEHAVARALGCATAREMETCLDTLRERSEEGS